MSKAVSIVLAKKNIIGNDIFYRYRRGTSDVFISFLHGYPTSSLDYDHLIGMIPDKYHVLAHDHLGFGRSDKPRNSSYLLFEQADITCALYEELGVRNLHIVAHDYGTSVTTEIIARHNEGSIRFDILSITLCNGSMLIDMAHLRIIQRLLKSKWVGNIVAKLSSESIFQRNMRNIWFDKTAYKKEGMSDHWQLLISDGGRKVLPKVTQYIDQRYTHYDRWIGGLKQSDLPYHILWAANDPVAIVDMAYKLDSIIKLSTLTIIDECGHYPMIEKGDKWLGHLLQFIESPSLGMKNNE